MLPKNVIFSAFLSFLWPILGKILGITLTMVM